MGTVNGDNPEIEDRGCMPCGHVRRESPATTGFTKDSEEPCSSKADKNRKKRLRKKRSKLRALTDRTVSSCASELEGCGTSLPFSEVNCGSRSPVEVNNIYSVSLCDTSSQVGSHIRFHIGHSVPVEELSAQSQPTCSCGVNPGGRATQQQKSSKKRMEGSSEAAHRSKKMRVVESAVEIDEETFDYGVVSAQQPGPKVYIHGNYHRYYGYRLGGAFDQDPRLSVLEKGWFHKKRCLDIGCNEGLVTLSLAKTFGTTSMTGIDLDEHLIKRACAYVATDIGRE